MRKLIILAVVLMVALVAVPAFASVQNVKVSGSVDSTYLFRDNFDFGDNTVGDTQQSLFITQTTLQVDADLTDQVSATVALINERAWSAPTVAGDQTDVDLNLAYVTLREMLYSPLTVVVGRQAFSYGNSFVIDSAGTNNAAPLDSNLNSVAEDLTKQTALDAIRLIFDYNPLTLEVLYSKVNANTLAGVPDDDDDIDLYGVNATYELGDDLNTQIETYFFARLDKLPAGNHSKSDTVYMPGLRASADVLDGLNVQGEIAWQRGNRANSAGTDNDNQKREAMAAQVISNYQVPNDVLPDGLEEYNPALQYVYTYVSGDSNPDDTATTGAAGTYTQNEWTAWDPMLENQGGGTIYNTLFNLSNAHIHAISLTANPIEDVTTTVTWTGLWLDKKFDSGTNRVVRLVQPDGNTTNNLQLDTGDQDLGYEIDVDTIYDYTEDVQFGASMGWYVPGDVFRGDTVSQNGNDKIASQVLLSGIVNF
ncbi:MAG: hypothetical protein KAS66_13835 [Candidatus Omnitrophica bacterium]|nr:hypothetical protein [Candidatus Omnitrophota bacterium]